MKLLQELRRRRVFRLAGLYIAYWATSLLAASIRQMLVVNTLSMELVLHAAPDYRVLLATTGFCVVSTLLFGFGPALRSSRPDLTTDLKDEEAVGHSRFLFGKSEHIRHRIETGFLVPAPERGLDGAGGPKILQWGYIGDADTELTTIAKVLFDFFWLMKEQQHQIGDSILFEQTDDVLHDRPVDQGNHRLGHADGQWMNAGAEATCHNDSFQWSLLGNMV